MTYIYFRKDTRQFAYTSATPDPLDCYLEFQVPDAPLNYTYILKADNTVVPDKQRPPVSGPPPLTEAEVNLKALRGARDQRLAETDWWAVADRTMTPEQLAYRQALRDITQTYQSIVDVVWPVKP